MNNGHDGGEEASHHQEDVHGHHELILGHLVFDSVLSRKLVHLSEDDHTDDASKPYEVDNECTGKEENLALGTSEIYMDSSSKIVEKVAIWHKYGNCCENNDNSDGSFHTKQNNNIADKSSGYKKHCPSTKIHQEE